MPILLLEMLKLAATAVAKAFLDHLTAAKPPPDTTGK